MAGFERFYGGEKYSPKRKLSDTGEASIDRKVDVTYKTKDVDSILNSGFAKASDATKRKVERSYIQTEFAEAIPYVQLSHSLDSVRSY